MKKLPPKCPGCGQRLVEVFENEYNTYVFDLSSGAYREHEWKGEMEILCPNCDAKLFDVFPDGVCNYVSKHKQKLKGEYSMNKKQAIYWLSVALQIHYEPEIIEAFKIAMDELSKEDQRQELRVSSYIN